MSTWSCLEPKAAGLLGGEVAVRELEDRPSQGVLALFTQQSAALAWQRWWFYLLPQVQQNAPLSREATEVPRFAFRFRYQLHSQAHPLYHTPYEALPTLCRFVTPRTYPWASLL